MIIKKLIICSVLCFIQSCGSNSVKIGTNESKCADYNFTDFLFDAFSEKSRNPENKKREYKECIERLKRDKINDELNKKNYDDTIKINKIINRNNNYKNKMDVEKEIKNKELEELKQKNNVIKNIIFGE